MFYYIITDTENNILYMNEEIENVDKKKEQFIKENKKIEIYYTSEIFNICELVYNN